MGLVFRRRERPQEERGYWGITGPGDLIPRRVGGSFGAYVNTRTAMQTSAVWAAIRLRADLISTLPIKCYRMAAINTVEEQQQIDANLSPFMAASDFMEFVYTSQVSLDSSGNAVGIINGTDKQGYPTDIDLKSAESVDVVINGETNKIRKYRIDGTEYDPSVIWHEKQFTFPGLHIGLSPVMYAAYSIGQYRTVQQFATEWFMAGQGPRASLKNNEKKISGKEATIVKEAWRASQVMGEPFVHGSDWEYSLVQAQEASADWLESQKLSLVDVSRFFGVPGDLIDAALAGGPSITYANVTQRNLQFLVMHLGPAIIRRENALSQLLPRPRFIKMDSDSLLRMDPSSRALMIRTQIESRVLAPSEARLMDNRQPFTPEQIAEFDELGLNKRGTTPQTTLAPEPPTDAPVAADMPDMTQGSNNG
jgi:HK97 family phage portal protein